MMSVTSQSEMVSKSVFIGEMQQLVDKLISKSSKLLPDGVPVEDFEELFNKVCSFIKEHDLTVSEANNVLWQLKNTFEKLTYEQKFNY